MLVGQTVAAGFGRVLLEHRKRFVRHDDRVGRLLHTMLMSRTETLLAATAVVGSGTCISVEPSIASMNVLCWIELYQ